MKNIVFTKKIQIEFKIITCDVRLIFYIGRILMHRSYSKLNNKTIVKMKKKLFVIQMYFSLFWSIKFWNNFVAKNIWEELLLPMGFIFTRNFCWCYVATKTNSQYCIVRMLNLIGIVVCSLLFTLLY